MATIEEATTALSAWDIQPHGSLKEILPGRVFKVGQTVGNGLILKAVPNERFENLLFEFEILQHLATSGVPVAVPLKTTDGQQTIDLQGACYTLSPCLIGDDDPEPGEWVDRLPSYGEVFARLHLALATYPDGASATKTWSNDPLGETFDKHIPKLLLCLTEEQTVKISQIAGAVEAEMREALADLPTQLIHRDLHDSNIISSGDRVVGIIDCDHFSFGTPMADIAYFLHHTVKWLTEADGTMIGNEGGKDWWLSWVPKLIQAYDRVRPLSEREKAALPYLMIWILISFVDLFHKKENLEEAQLYLHLLDFVSAHRAEITQRVLNAE